MQERNAKEVGFSNSKVNEARERSPAGKFAASSPPRGKGSPLRSSYGASYKY